MIRQMDRVFCSVGVEGLRQYHSSFGDHLVHPSEIIWCILRSTLFALAGPPNRPKLFPNRIAVSKELRGNLRSCTDPSFTFLRPLPLQTFSASREISNPTTSNPFR